MSIMTPEQYNTAITRFINDRITREVPILDFLRDLASEFYSDLDLEFMIYFLELSKKENRYKFMVPHTKLQEYGITTSERSSNVMKKIVKMSLVEGVHYTLLRTEQRNINGRGSTTSNFYSFTPQGFKRLLLGASRHQNHSIDVNVYKDYYIFLEDAIQYYGVYQKSRSDMLIANKDSTIAELKEDMEELKSINQDQTSKIEQLMIYAADTNATIRGLDESHDRKSRLCSLRLDNKSLENYFGSTMYIIHDENNQPIVRVQNIRAQRKKIIPTMKSYIEGKYRTNRNIPVKTNHGIAIPPIYFPNAITLCARVEEKFNKVVKPRLIKEFNSEYKSEIKNGERVKLNTKDFPVKICKLYVEYHPNDVISFNQVMGLYVDEIKHAQGCAIDIPANKILDNLMRKHRSKIDRRFAEEGFAAERKLLQSLNEDVANIANTLASNIFRGVFENPIPDDE